MGGSEKEVGATASPQPAGQASPRAQEVSAKGDHQAQGAAHTPGPWQATTNAYGCNFVQRWKVGVGHELICGGNNHDTLTEANAHLIAAAPDLYEAVRDCPLPSTMGSAAEHYQRFYDWYNGPVRAALTKATGAA